MMAVERAPRADGALSDHGEQLVREFERMHGADEAAPTTQPPARRKASRPVGDHQRPKEKR